MDIATDLLPATFQGAMNNLIVYIQWPLLLTWFNSNPNMDK